MKHLSSYSHSPAGKGGCLSRLNLRCSRTFLAACLIASVMTVICCQWMGNIGGLGTVWGYDPMDAVSAIISSSSSSMQQHEHVQGQGHVHGLEWETYASDEGVIFLKTHKTGSSSLTAVFWRNLCVLSRRNCFLPPAATPGKTWDLTKSTDMEAILHGASTRAAGGAYPFDAWMFHAHYNEALYEVVGNTDRMISIVRRPALRFRSAWSWYGHGQALQMSLETFADKFSPMDSGHGVSAERMYGMMLGGGLGLGSGSPPAFKYRTGLDATSEELVGQQSFGHHFFFFWRQRSLYEQLLERVRNGRLILLVTDRFDHSLVILGRLMGWPPEQLVYSRLKSGPEATEYLTLDKTLSQLDAMQPFDFALWKLANHMLDVQIHRLFSDEEEFDKHVRSFQELNEKVNADCKFMLADKTDVDRNHKKQCEELFHDNMDAVKHVWNNK